MDGPTRSAYFPALDGLRTVCCVWVIFGHGFVFHPIAQYAGRLAGMGVRVFFALSGFLITTLLLRELSSRGRVDLRAFYMRRVLRIFPVYYSALAFALVGLLVLRDPFARFVGVKLSEIDIPQIAWTHFLFLANWTDTPLPGALAVLWSISVEEQFYVLFPITFARSKRPLPALRPIMIGIAIALAVRVYCVLTRPEEMYKNTFATGDHLLLGAFAAQLVHVNRDAMEKWVRRWGTPAEIAAFGMIFLLCAWTRERAWEWYVESSLSAIASAAIVLFIAVGNGAFARFFELRWMRKAGQLTYAAYVFHMYGVGLAWAVCARLHLGVALEAPLRTLLAIPLAFGMAWIVRLAFEARILALKERFERA